MSGRNSSSTSGYRARHSGLGWYRQWPWEPERAILVAGETPWDFTLYYALLRWRGPSVFWLPQSLTEDTVYTRTLGAALRDAARRAEDHAVTVVTSSDEDFRDQAVAELAAGTWTLLSVAASAVDWRAVVPEDPYRLLDGERPGRAEPVAVHDGATVELPTPIPAAAGEGPNRLRWVTDVRAHGWAPVRHGSLATALLEQPMFGSDYARTGRNGVAYTSTGAITVGSESLAMSTVRPILRPIALLAQLDAALRTAGPSRAPTRAPTPPSRRGCSAGSARWRPRCLTRPLVASSKPSATATRQERAPRTAATSRSPTWLPCWAATARAPRTSSTG